MNSARRLPFADFDAHAASLLASAGVTQKRSMTRCAQGANNRLYKVETREGTFAIKEYFRSADDPRDRLASETKFLEYANAASPGRTPRLFAYDEVAGLALLEFIDGRRLDSGEVGADAVDAAIAFFRDLNAPDSVPSANLPPASEARFSIEDHLALVDARVSRLLDLEGHTPTDAEALAVSRRLSDAWQHIAEGIRRNLRQARFEDGLAKEDWCISPSDFGFHNALVEPGGRVRFLDFEYAGWDDPAKTIGDFFAQPAVPVPQEYFSRFTTGCLSMMRDPEAATLRATLLRPVYRVKWCCIALNVFVPAYLARRRFANSTLDEGTVKQTQLQIADRILRQITSR